MPIYTYRCRKCGQTFTQIESMKDEPTTSVGEHKSPKDKWCKGQVFRVVGGAAVHYKGNGWSGAGRDRQK